MTGGQGEVVTITSAGRLTDDNTNTAPLTGTVGGAQVSAKVTGDATGRLTTSHGQITATVDNPNSITITVTENGQVVGTSHGNPGAGSYTCSKGSALTIQSIDGETTTYAPA